MDYPRAQRLVLDLVAAHGLTDWTIKFNDKKREFGVCWHREKRLEFSKPLILANDEHELIDTVLHEIAHAFAGHAAGHGPEWKAVARRLGARPESHSYDAKAAPGRYVGACPCGEEFIKYRRPRAVRLCIKCKGKITYLDTETGLTVRLY